jgi:DNA gyrase/topoisomerase IV subunit B
MDPERRTLLSVRLEDIAECETIFSTLMGEDALATGVLLHYKLRAGAFKPAW